MVATSDARIIVMVAYALDMPVVSPKQQIPPALHYPASPPPNGHNPSEDNAASDNLEDRAWLRLSCILRPLTRS